MRFDVLAADVVVDFVPTLPDLGADVFLLADRVAGLTLALCFNCERRSRAVKPFKAAGFVVAAFFK